VGGRVQTKLHEVRRAGSLGVLANSYAEGPPRGEVTLVLQGTGVAPADPDRTADAAEAASRLLAEGLTRKEVARRLSQSFGLSRNDAYRLVMGLP
jgi:16S rRNA (cytidine1402-2'-O)-methyltransferase